jgi:hypothetical protein
MPTTRRPSPAEERAAREGKGNREAIAGTGAIALAFTGALYLITDQVQANDHHDQPERQPHPNIALHQRRHQLRAAHRAEQLHPAPVGLPARIVVDLVHHSLFDLRRFPG